MRQRAPYLIIGVLVGIIVMQWAMPAAQGALQSSVVYDSLTLMSSSGKRQARLYTTSSGGPELEMSADLDDGSLPVTSLSVAADGTMFFLDGGDAGIVEIHAMDWGVWLAMWRHQPRARYETGASLSAGPEPTLRIHGQGDLETDFPAMIGDLDFDGDVDLDDFFMLSDNFGKRAAKPVTALPLRRARGNRDGMTE